MQMNMIGILKNPAHALNQSQEGKINCLGHLSQTHKSHYDLILALLLPSLPKVEKPSLHIASKRWYKSRLQGKAV